MPASVDLVDASVWVPLLVPEHEHHGRALRYWQLESATAAGFCRVTMLALLRHLMNPRIMLGAVLAPGQAWAYYERWRGTPGVVYLDEPSGIESRLARLCQNGGFGSRGLTDAYLAAFAQEAECRLVSFDGGFQRFRGLDFLHLRP